MISIRLYKKPFYPLWSLLLELMDPSRSGSSLQLRKGDKVNDCAVVQNENTKTSESLATEYRQLYVVHCSKVIVPVNFNLYLMQSSQAKKLSAQESRFLLT